MTCWISRNLFVCVTGILFTDRERGDAQRGDVVQQDHHLACAGHTYLAFADLRRSRASMPSNSASLLWDGEGEGGACRELAFDRGDPRLTPPQPSPGGLLGKRCARDGVAALPRRDDALL